jgi:predicted TIM-barrel enzyme
MSKLAERIKRAGRTEAAPIGFGVASERSAAPTLVCLLRLDKDQAKKAGGAAASGADAVIVTGLEAEKLGEVAKKLREVPVGVSLDGAQRSSVETARKAGADFVRLDQRSSAEAVLEEEAGLVLRVDADISDTELRALAGLSLDALEVAPLEEPFTLQRLIELRRLSLLAQTPLLVEVTPDVGTSGLEALREAGVTGVILDGKSAGKLTDLPCQKRAAGGMSGVRPCCRR